LKLVFIRPAVAEFLWVKRVDPETIASELRDEGREVLALVGAILEQDDP
jgi:hypothetical protein